MEDRGVQLLGVVQMDNGSFKERLIGAIFGPAIVPLIHVGVMQFMALGFELVPLNSSM